MTMAFMGLGGIELLLFLSFSLIPLALFIFLLIRFLQIAADTRKMKSDMDEIKEYLRQIIKLEQEKKP